MLIVKDIHIFYGGVHAIKGISFKVAEGTIVVLLGPNGAGKSTILKAISGLIPLAEGDIQYQGGSIRGYDPADIVRLGISHVPEGRMIFPDLTVKENLEMGAYISIGRRNIRKDLAKCFEYFPILARKSSQRGEVLSGGEQQMLAIARGLMARPRLLLLDEPSLGLSPIFVEEIFKIMQEIIKNGTTILMVEQNAEMALSLADYGYVLEVGKIVLDETCDVLRKTDLIKRYYLGE